MQLDEFGPLVSTRVSIFFVVLCRIYDLLVVLFLVEREFSRNARKSVLHQFGGVVLSYE
jgi:high-affinity nickel permease